MGLRRDRWEVTRLILKTLAEVGSDGATLSKVSYAVELNASKSVRGFMQVLASKGCIRFDPNNPTDENGSRNRKVLGRYFITAKGMEIIPPLDYIHEQMKGILDRLA